MTLASKAFDTVKSPTLLPQDMLPVGLSTGPPAITQVQKTSNKTTANATQLTATFASNPTAGNLLICCVNTDAFGISIVNSGWGMANFASSFAVGAIFYRTAVAGDPKTVTVATDGTSTSIELMIFEYSGLVNTSFIHPADPLDVVANATPPGAPLSLSTGTTSATGYTRELSIAMWGTDDAHSGPATAITHGYTLETTGISSSGTVSGSDSTLYCASKILSAASVGEESSITLTSQPQVSPIGIIATFRAPAGAASTVTTLAPGAIVGDTDTAYDFSNAYMKASNVGPQLAAAWSMEAWINIRDTSNAPTVTCIFGWVNPADGYRYGLFLWQTGPAGNLPVAWAVCYANATQSLPLTIGWHHLVATWNSSVGISLYVDGVLASTYFNFYDGVVHLPTLSIGGDSYYGTTLNAQIDECAFYPIALTPTQIQNHYNIGKNKGGLVVPAENISYSPDGSNVVDRIWVIGGSFQGPNQTYLLDPKPNGTQSVFPLPTRIQNARSVTVLVNGVDQGSVGVLGVDGTLDQPSAYKYNVLISQIPPIVAFRSDSIPANGVTVALTGNFTYPLIRIVSDAAKIQKLGGLIFEKVLREKRIDNVALADSVGNTHLALQGTAKAQGSATIFTRSNGGLLLQPGQAIQIQNHALFAGNVLDGGGSTLQAIVNQLTTKLIEDNVSNYSVDVQFSDRPDLGDDDIFDHITGEQNRINAALDQSDINTIVQDFQAITSDIIGFQPETLTTNRVYLYGQADALYDGTARYA